MDIGLVGDHPAGVELARALVAHGGFKLAGFVGPEESAEHLRASGLGCGGWFRDLEALLVLHGLEVVIVADELDQRAQTLRRAVQSDKHVLCVHPPDLLPDVTYEVAMVQQETRKVLLPILPARLSPALVRFREHFLDGALGNLELVHWEHVIPRVPRHDSNAWDQHPLLTLWDVLRFLGGEIKDVSAVGPELEQLAQNDPLTITGHFESYGLFRVLLTPSHAPSSSRLTIRCTGGEAEIVFAADDTSHLRITCLSLKLEQELPPFAASEATAAQFAAQLAGAAPKLTWLDATRCLELHEAARSSLKRRRVVPLHYEEFTETSNFKGVMAAWGCGVLVLALVILVGLLVFRVPLKLPLLFVLLPLLILFLVLQLLRWIVPAEKSEPDVQVRDSS